MLNQPIRISVTLLAASGAAWAQIPTQPGPAQIEQVRQVAIPESRISLSPKPKPQSEIEAFDAETDDAFGAQVILKENPKVMPFTGWAEVAGFYTNNVALARRGRLDDTFLTNTFGLAYHKALKPALMFDASVRGSLYRYNRFNELDFQSLDPSVSLTWLPGKLENTALYVRYGYNQLTAASDGHEFFNSHSVAIGAQKAWPLARAHSVIAGLQAQWSWAAPSESQRDEYSAYVGYHADIARNFSTDLNYRFAVFDYRDSPIGRRDHSHIFTLGFRYALEDWLSVSATTFWNSNSSNHDVFSYEVWNIGGNLGLSAKF
jgi:hypothetical protein